MIGFVSSKLLTGEGVYRHIDWPVVILLAAMIPIGNTLINYGKNYTTIQKLKMKSILVLL